MDKYNRHYDLEKSDFYNVETLWTIVLFEVDFNRTNIISAERDYEVNYILKENSSGKYCIPEGICIDYVLSRNLILGRTMYTKRSLEMMICDLKSCYD